MALYRFILLSLILLTIIGCSKKESTPTSFIEPSDTTLPKITWKRIGLDSLNVKALLGWSGIFVATDQGIFVSTDHGASWKLSGLPNTAVTLLTANTMGGNAIYAGTANNGVFVSMNNGWTWRQCGLEGRPIHSLHNFGSTLFAGTSDSGLYISTNTLDLQSSTKWQKLIPGFPITKPLFTLFDGGNLLAGSYGVYSSTDGGETWIFTSKNIDSSHVYAFAKMAGYTIVGTDKNGIFRSSNNTTEWVPIVSNLTDKKVVTFCFNGNVHLFAGTSDSGVYRSTDLGNNWSKVSDSLTNMHIQSLYYNNGYLFAATTNGLYKSSLVDKPRFP